MTKGELVHLDAINERSIVSRGWHKYELVHRSGVWLSSMDMGTFPGGGRYVDIDEGDLLFRVCMVYPRVVMVGFVSTEAIDPGERWMLFQHQKQWILGDGGGE